MFTDRRVITDDYRGPLGHEAGLEVEAGGYSISNQPQIIESEPLPKEGLGTFHGGTWHVFGQSGKYDHYFPLSADDSEELAGVLRERVTMGNGDPGVENGYGIVLPDIEWPQRYNIELEFLDGAFKYAILTKHKPRSANSAGDRLLIAPDHMFASGARPIRIAYSPVGALANDTFS